ncbi:hypothetical protein DFH28DRAFT_1094576 [Melampsora americana]|nr:hypothetical protein DFH28DRAFT_1094576 [Melampsora americana]
MSQTNDDIKKPIPSNETEPLLPQPGPSQPQPQPQPVQDRPKTVRHHRRTLSGRSVRSGHFQFGPSYHPNIYPAVNDPFTRQSKRAADARARSRFFKALLLGVGLWVVIGLVLGWTSWQESGWGDGNNRLNYGAKPEIPKQEGNVVQCASFDKEKSLGKKFRSKSEFMIHLKQEDQFFIHSKGSFAKGRMSIGISDSNESKKVKVEVEALYNDEALIDLMNVCEVSGHDGEHNKAGLAIYTPSPEVGPYPNSDLEFRLNIILPRSLKSLYTFEIRADDLSSIDITRLDLGTTVGSITLSNILSHIVRIRTKNGDVEATTNGAINAEIGLFPPSEEDSKLPQLPPNPPSKASSPDNYTSVHATTTNGAVILQYTHHPVDQTLYSFVSSTNGKAEVEHPPAFEGQFEAETVWGSAIVKGPGSKKDPKEGGQRIRKKIIRSDRDELGYRHISGSVWWDDGNGEENKAGKGESVVKTTLGSAKIVFE